MACIAPQFACMLVMAISRRAFAACLAIQIDYVPSSVLSVGLECGLAKGFVSYAVCASYFCRVRACKSDLCTRERHRVHIFPVAFWRQFYQRVINAAMEGLTVLTMWRDPASSPIPVWMLAVPTKFRIGAANSALFKAPSWLLFCCFTEVTSEGCAGSCSSLRQRNLVSRGPGTVCRPPRGWAKSHRRGECVRKVFQGVPSAR